MITNARMTETHTLNDGADPTTAANAKSAAVEARNLASERLLILEPGRAERHYWRDLWRYRELFAILAWRDMAVRYKQTVIGVAWALIRPFLTMVVFTVMFGRHRQAADRRQRALSADGVRRHAALDFLSRPSCSEASNSLIGNANLISKVYFPRLIMPTASVVVALVDFLISFAILVVHDGLVSASCRAGRSCCCRSSSLLALLASLGPALWITALNVKYRDFRYVIPFIVQFGLYVSPVGFQLDVVPEQWRLLVFASIRWSASSTAFAGASSAARASSICRASLRASA